MTKTGHKSIDRLIVEDESGCHIWVGTVKQNGYGYINWNGTHTTIHRVVYTLTVGDIPDGMQIDHLCRNRKCCNPAHLEAVTQAENLRRGAEARGHKKKPQDRDFDYSKVCSNGHIRTSENTVSKVQPNGVEYLQCRVCQRDRMNKLNALRRAT